jgi:predicted nucleic acid-binding protein
MSMKQNDLWIAATAVATGATLVTTDKDFDHLNGLWLERVLVDQSAKLS